MLLRATVTRLNRPRRILLEVKRWGESKELYRTLRPIGNPA